MCQKMSTQISAPKMNRMTANKLWTTSGVAKQLDPKQYGADHSNVQYYI